MFEVGYLKTSKFYLLKDVLYNIYIVHFDIRLVTKSCQNNMSKS